MYATIVNKRNFIRAVCTNANTHVIKSTKSILFIHAIS